MKEWWEQSTAQDRILVIALPLSVVSCIVMMVARHYSWGTLAKTIGTGLLIVVLSICVWQIIVAYNVIPFYTSVHAVFKEKTSIIGLLLFPAVLLFMYRSSLMGFLTVLFKSPLIPSEPSGALNYTNYASFGSLLIHAIKRVFLIYDLKCIIKNNVQYITVLKYIVLVLFIILLVVYNIPHVKAGEANTNFGVDMSFLHNPMFSTFTRALTPILVIGGAIYSMYLMITLSFDVLVWLYASWQWGQLSDNILIHILETYPDIASKLGFTKDYWAHLRDAFLSSFMFSVPRESPSIQPYLEKYFAKYKEELATSVDVLSDDEKKKIQQGGKVTALKFLSKSYFQLKDLFIEEFLSKLLKGVSTASEIAKLGIIKAQEKSGYSILEYVTMLIVYCVVIGIAFRVGDGMIKDRLMSPIVKTNLVTLSVVSLVFISALVITVLLYTFLEKKLLHRLAYSNARVQLANNLPLAIEQLTPQEHTYKDVTYLHRTLLNPAANPNERRLEPVIFNMSQFLKNTGSIQLNYYIIPSIVAAIISIGIVMFYYTVKDSYADRVVIEAPETADLVDAEQRYNTIQTLFKGLFVSFMVLISIVIFLLQLSGHVNVKNWYTTISIFAFSGIILAVLIVLIVTKSW
jgi:hypothetical protein